VTEYPRVVLLLILILLVSPSYCLGPLALGTGKGTSMANLDRGASQSGYKPSFAYTGFAAPSPPQTMALSPGAMVHQAQALLDESESLRDQTAVLFNRTAALAGQVQNLADETRASADSAQRDVKLSSNYASEGELRLNEMKSIYNKTVAEAKMVSGLTKRNEALIAQAGLYANQSAWHADYARRYLNQSIILSDQIALVSQEAAALKESGNFPVTKEPDFI
jgi:hypothetical protein